LRGTVVGAETSGSARGPQEAAEGQQIYCLSIACKRRVGHEEKSSLTSCPAEDWLWSRCLT
jgi:hypothetical protein